MVQLPLEPEYYKPKTSLLSFPLREQSLKNNAAIYSAHHPLQEHALCMFLLQKMFLPFRKKKKSEIGNLQKAHGNNLQLLTPKYTFQIN